MKRTILGLVLILSLVGCSKIEQDDSQLIVGMECAYPPFNWFQTHESETAVKTQEGMYCDGYDVQIAKIIAESLDKELVIHVNGVFDALLTDVKNGTIDLIIAGMTDTEERRQTIDFTDIYYYTDIVVMVREDSELANATSIHDFAGYRVSAQTGTTHDQLIDQMQGAQHMMPMDNFPTLTTNLVNNAIDAFIAENVVAQAIVLTNPSLTYLTFQGDHNFEIDEDMSVSIGIAKGNDTLKSQINDVLSTLDYSDRNELMNDAISRTP